MNTSDFINNAEYLIRQCLNQTQIDPLMKAWLQDACLDLAMARKKDIQKTEILQAAFPEKSGHFFICGEAGEKEG